MHAEILKSVIVLVAWSLVMLVWAVATRAPAMKAAGIDLGRLVGSTAAQADKVLPPHVQWKVHNYNHLMEQPTLFYAVALVLAVVGQGGGMNAALAWGYVVLRVAHSVVQATINRVAIRLALFAASTLCLVGLTLHAAMALF